MSLGGISTGSSIGSRSNVPAQPAQAPVGDAAAPAAGSQYIAAAPQPGAQAGSVAASGGDVEYASHAALNAGRAGVVAAQQYAKTQQAPLDQSQAGNPVAGAAAPAAAQNAAPTGPAAWDDSWGKKFREAGVPDDVIQQLTFTGGGGADANQLQQVLDGMKQQIDAELAKFAHEHPEEFKELRAAEKRNHGVFVQSFGMNLAQIAAGVNAKQINDEALVTSVETAKTLGANPVTTQLKSLATTMLPYSFIPGWGALRVPLSWMNHGKDIFSGEEIKLDFWNQGPMGVLNALQIGGGLITLTGLGMGVRQSVQGYNLLKDTNSLASQVAKGSGFEVDKLTGFQKFKSFVPTTQLNKQIAGFSRLDADLAAGLDALPKGSIERELAELTVQKLKSGDVQLLGDSTVKRGWAGIFNHERGILMGRKKELLQVLTQDGKTTLLADRRMVGRTLVAQLAKAGVHLADGDLKRRVLMAAGVDAATAAKTGTIGADLLKTAGNKMLGNAFEQLKATGFVAAPTGLGKAMSALRPGPLADAMKAASGTLGQPGPFKRLSGLGKFGVIAGGAAAVAGAGYLFVNKQQQDAAKAEAEAAKQQQTAIPPEVQAALQQFAQLPADQQAAFIEQNGAQLQQASQQPNLTDEQKAQISAAAATLQLFQQVAQGGAASVTGGGQAPAGAQQAAPGQAQAQVPAAAATQQPAAQPAAQQGAALAQQGAGAGAGSGAGAGAQAPADQGGFTARGLGLAG